MAGIQLGLIGSFAAAAPAGAFESIATVTAAGGETSISFSSIPATYKSLQIRATYRDTDDTQTRGGIGLGIRVNNDDQGNYAKHYLRSLNSTSQLVQAGGTATSAFRTMWNLVHGGMYSGGSNTSNYGVSIIDFIDYDSTSKNKTMRAFTGEDNNVATSSFTGVGLESGLWTNTAAITDLTFYPGAVAFASGSTFSLYGIKGA